MPRGSAIRAPPARRAVAAGEARRNAGPARSSHSFIAAAASEPRAAGRKINKPTAGRTGPSHLPPHHHHQRARGSGDHVLAVVAFAARVLHGGELQEVHRPMHLPPAAAPSAQTAAATRLAAGS